jgi:outer membrane protein assembly factor BamB
VLVDGAAYFGSADGNFYALDAQTGVERWHHPFGDSSSTPAVAAGSLYTAVGNGNLVALNSQTGETLWTYAPQDSLYPPVVCGDAIVTTSDRGLVYAVDAQTGTPRWQFAIGFQAYWPVIVDQLLLVSNGAATIAAFGARAIRFEPGAKARVIAGATLRGAPSATSVARAELEAGTVVTLTGAAEATGSIIWWPVSVDDTGFDGWVEETSLEIV